MNNFYSTLLEKVKASLNADENLGEVISEDSIYECVETEYKRFCKKYPDFNLSPDGIQAIISELLSFYAVTMSEADSALFESRINSTWWTDSAETRKSENKNYYWDSYKKYLMNKDNLPKDVIERIDERTDKVMNYLFDPSNPDISKATRRGMVVGSVQSGKTANYSALVCKAADAGYKIIIIIAGISSLLRKQTQFRIDSGFVGQVDNNRDNIDVTNEELSEENTVADYRSRNRAEREMLRPYVMTTEKLSGDFRSNSRRSLEQTNLNNTTSPIVFVIKKNTTVLEQILTWLSGKDVSDKSLLLIDDEADNASVNTKKNPDELTAINKKIRLILKQFNKSAYVGFTATPFANIFIDPRFEENPENRDLYPKDFIISLNSPDNYFGPKTVFDEESVEDAKYIRVLAEEQTHEAKNDWAQFFPTKQKKGVSFQKVTDIPDTLKEAINVFLFNIYLRNKRGHTKKHNSMLIHVSFLIDMHRAIADRVREYLNELGNNLQMYAGMPNSAEYKAIISPLKDLYEDPSLNWAMDDRFEKPEFEEVLPGLADIVQSITVGMSNSIESSIQYSENKQINVIAVGGNSLARGFTIENLSVSYFLRNTKMCDTLLQMGRWFGYRKDYQDLCKIYTTEKYYENFHDAWLATKSLVECIEKMEKQHKTPEDFLVTVSQHPATQTILTARNKMYNAGNRDGVYLDGTIREKGTFSEGNAKEELLEVASYYKHVYDFVSELPEGERLTKGYRWLNVSSDKIIKLMEKCPKSFSSSMDVDLLIRYIRENGQFNWRVVLPSLQSGETTTLGKDIIIHKIKRFNKIEDDASYSFAVSDRSHEELGSTEEELIKLKLSKEKETINTRQELRNHRNQPLLIINIADLYPYCKKEERNKKQEAVFLKNFPLLSLSFPGSFSDPLFQPLTGFYYNQKMQEKLREEFIDNIEEYDEDEGEE